MDEAVRAGGGDADASKSAPMLELAHVSRWFGQVIAVNDITVQIGPGITGLLGPNGAGKTTIMRMAVGLLSPSQGAVRVMGEDPWNNPGLLGRIGYVPEGPPPWRELTGAACVARGAMLCGATQAQARQQATDALARVGLEEDAQRSVSSYSQGMQQRVKFALALVHDPEVFVLDEPLLGADPASRRRLLGIMRDLAGRGRSILLSTHVLSDVEALTDRIMLVGRGRLLAHGDVQEVRDLLDRFPRTVRIATSRPGDLARQMVVWDGVKSVGTEGQTVVVRTREAAAFYPRLQRLLLEQQIPFESITSPDDNVEAVFQYLTEASP